MAMYYKVTAIEEEDPSTFDGIQVHTGDPNPAEGPSIQYDFSKHVLIELLDNVTPDAKLWKELGLVSNKKVAHKRLLIDPHRKNCRRAIVVCKSSDDAIELARRLTQTKIMKRCICAVVIQKLLSDLRLFEEQIIQYGDKGSQHQFVYVTDLNRPREPETLVRYLREKFSPFGTILSVLVSEDKNGYALPEAVIRYAHLSEAFAAELAYDQCAVAMERLTVQTHHNILLSQCDLKARLKEAQLKYSKGVPDGDIESIPKVINSVSNNHEKDSDARENSNINSESPIPTDSAELADVLENSCQENLVDCLKGMGSESSFSKLTSTAPASGCESQDIDQEIPRRSSPAVRDKTWSSRIMGWITDIPNANDMPNYNDSFEERSGSQQNHSFQDHNPADIVSNDSFVTCTNGDVNASINSNPPSPASTVRCEINDRDQTLQFVSPEKSNSSIEGNQSPEAVLLSIENRIISPISTSHKRKNSSILTQKLSLKSQRLDSSQPVDVSESETTVHLPSVANIQQCYVALNTMPELDKLVENMNGFKSPDPPEKSQQHTSREVLETSIDALSIKSTRSLPVRRSSRHLASSSDNRKSASVCGDKRENDTSASQQNRLSDVQEESPLRAWLKKELKNSTNNRIAFSQESAKSILCATANEDVLVSVGCSHMTCDFCYPDSTQLLLGGHNALEEKTLFWSRE